MNLTVLRSTGQIFAECPSSEIFDWLFIFKYMMPIYFSSNISYHSIFMILYYIILYYIILICYIIAYSWYYFSYINFLLKSTCIVHLSPSFFSQVYAWEFILIYKNMCIFILNYFRFIKCFMDNTYLKICFFEILNWVH